MTLAGIVDYFGYGFEMVVLMGIPAAGLVVNIAGMQRQGLNRNAGIAAGLFFLTLLIQGSVVTLSSSGSISEEWELRLMVSTGICNVLGALLALWALSQIRRKHRWPRGRKRAIAVFWLNVLAIAAMGATYYLRANPDKMERIFG
jgi:hypothetical protein